MRDVIYQIIDNSERKVLFNYDLYDEMGKNHKILPVNERSEIGCILAFLSFNKEIRSFAAEKNHKNIVKKDIKGKINDILPRCDGNLINMVPTIYEHFNNNTKDNICISPCNLQDLSSFDMDFIFITAEIDEGITVLAKEGEIKMIGGLSVYKLIGIKFENNLSNSKNEYYIYLNGRNTWTSCMNEYDIEDGKNYDEIFDIEDSEIKNCKEEYELLVFVNIKFLQEE